MLPKAITDYLAAQRPAHLAAAQELIRFPSISSQAEHEGDCRACAEWIAARLAGLGLTAELRPWRQHPVLIARSRPDMAPAGAPTIMLYGHYDVQPPDPLDLWRSPPFEPTIRDGAIYARGASDDKGQLFAHLAAVEAHLRAAGRLPANVIFFLEGEEEIGSPEMEQFMARLGATAISGATAASSAAVPTVLATGAGHVSAFAGPIGTAANGAAVAPLQADCVVISDSEFFAPGVPAITYGLRGLVYVEITVEGPSGDLHSGLHGGVVVNPLNALAALVAALHDADGRVTLPGFYDDVVETTDDERRRWRALPFDEGQYAREIGAAPLGGERGRDFFDRRWARPALDCHGIVGGYVGEGSKTVLPARATAKISCRLVPDQRPERVVECFRRFLAERTPAGVRSSLRVFGMARPVLTDPSGPAVAAVAAGLREAFGAEPALVRCGASVPITELFQRVLGIEPVVAGFGLPDDNLHAPNEHYRLDQFFGGLVAAAAMLENLGGLQAGRVVKR